MADLVAENARIAARELPDHDRILACFILRLGGARFELVHQAGRASIRSVFGCFAFIKAGVECEGAPKPRPCDSFPSVSLVPVMRGAGIDLQWHLHVERRHRGILHDRDDQRDRTFDIGILDLEYQFVMHLQQHAHALR